MLSNRRFELPSSGSGFPTEAIVGTIACVCILLVGYLLGLVEVESVVAATGLILAIGVCAGVATLAAMRLSDDRREREVAATNARIFSALLDGPLGEGYTGDAQSTFSLISQHDALQLESFADEMWVFAHDLAWDASDGFHDVVGDNLREGRAYRYIVPDDPQVLTRARGMFLRYQGLPDIETRLLFRVRANEVPFAPFGITIYNPRFTKSLDRLPDGESAVVLFPHLRDSRVGPTPFLRVAGPAVGDYEQRFDALWRLSDKSALAFSSVLSEDGA
jgi:hypothetical protein